MSHKSASSLALLLAACLVPFLFACGGSPGAQSTTVKIVAAENFWGSIASQVGGTRVTVTNIIADPDADPHSYEPTAKDARAIADAQYVILNGVGYDGWMDKLLSANPNKSRMVLDIGDLNGKKEGDNPHLWYNPDYVKAVADRVTADLKLIDAKDAAAFDTSEQGFLASGLQKYNGLISDIKAKYSGTKVGATESIFAYLAPSLGLNLITPASYMNAVSEGDEISATDQAMVQQQIDQKEIAILVYNSQNTPPNIQALIDRAKAKGIPVAKVTETLTPANATFQEWQAQQLQGIADALKAATGR